MKRLDHSMIFVFIAGTYTPFCLLVVRGVMGGVLLVAAWAVAGVGVSLHLCRPVPPRRVNGLYLGLGWLAVAGLPQILLNASTPVVTLLVTGGLIYTVGAVIFSARWPDPIPRVFGYHEVWHCMVVGACACHYAMLWLLVR
jgi:hemolysin III